MTPGAPLGTTTVVLVGVSNTCAKAGVTNATAKAATRMNLVMRFFLCETGEHVITCDVSRIRCHRGKATGGSIDHRHRASGESYDRLIYAVMVYGWTV